MRFFTPKSDFTHFGSLNGIPIYIADKDGDAPMIAGKNVITDWIVLWWPGFVMWCSCRLLLLAMMCGAVSADDCANYEPHWAICVKGKLPNAKRNQ